MTDQRLDAMVPRKRNDKTYWIKVGSAWPAKTGIGYQIVLDVLPLPDSEGRCVINLFQPKAQDDRKPARQTGQEPLDDEIPF